MSRTERSIMNYSRPAAELIAIRSSHRTYSSRQPEENLRTEINRMLGILPAQPFACSARFELVDMAGADDQTPRRLGTYGVIRGARWFIVGAVRKAPRDMEDFGYLMEAAILGMTDLGLGTCWLGGTFKRTDYGRRINVRSDETVPAITPVGYPAENRAITDRLIRWSAGSNKRKAPEELFFENDFSHPVNDLNALPWADAFQAVRMAPSASNLQPWRLLIERKSGTVHFFLTRSRGYDRLIRAADLQRIDMGIAMCHFELCVRQYGKEGRWVDRFPPDVAFTDKTEYIASWVME